MNDVTRLVAGTACCAWLVIVALLCIGLCWIAARGDRQVKKHGVEK